jgi:branched-chain amino acid transport system substrate-binding protein
MEKLLVTDLTDGSVSFIKGRHSMGFAKWCFIAASANFLIASSSSLSAQEVKDINLAVVAPLSGSMMAIVDPALKSAKLAIDEVNAAGLLVNGQRYQLKASWFDEECKPQVAVNAVRAALSQVQPLTLVVGILCSSSALAVAPILTDAKVLVVNPTSGTAGFAGPKGNPYLFKMKEGFEQRSLSVAKYLAARGMKKGVIVAVNSDWGEESVRSFKTAAQEAGITIAKTLNYDEQTEEFVPLLVQARQTDPDFIFVGSQLINEQVAFLRAYRQLGLKSQLVGESTWTEDVAEKIGWPSIDGMIVGSAWVPSDNRPAVQAYVEKYKKLVGGTPGFNGPLCYDAIHIIAEAIANANSTNPEAIRKTLRERTFKGLVYGAGDLLFNQDGQANYSISVTRFDAGKRERVVVPPVN